MDILYITCLMGEPELGILPLLQNLKLSTLRKNLERKLNKTTWNMSPEVFVIRLGLFRDFVLSQIGNTTNLSWKMRTIFEPIDRIPSQIFLSSVCIDSICLYKFNVAHKTSFEFGGHAISAGISWKSSLHQMVHLQSKITLPQKWNPPSAPIGPFCPVKVQHFSRQIQTKFFVRRRIVGSVEKRRMNEWLRRT